MFKLEIETTNDAFQNGDAGIELQRILNKLADNVYDGATEGVVMDINGNRVGLWQLTQD